jgi:hypothetical protein
VSHRACSVVILLWIGAACARSVQPVDASHFGMELYADAAVDRDAKNFDETAVFSCRVTSDGTCAVIVPGAICCPLQGTLVDWTQRCLSRAPSRGVVACVDTKFTRSEDACWYSTVTCYTRRLQDGGLETYLASQYWPESFVRENSFTECDGAFRYLVTSLPSCQNP